NIKVGAVLDNGKILLKNTRPTLAIRGKDQIIQDIIEQIEEILYELNISKDKLQSIGIGVPGLVDYRRGNIIYVPNLFWQDVPLGKILGKHFNRPIFVDNDATIAALAEKLIGSTQGMKNSVFI